MAFRTADPSIQHWSSNFQCLIISQFHPHSNLLPTACSFSTAYFLFVRVIINRQRVESPEYYVRYSRLPNMPVRESSTDPLKEYDISDVINQKDNGPETMAVIEKYSVLRAAHAKLREKLVGAKNDAVETRTILAGNMSVLHRKVFEEHLCGLDNEISELEAKVNNTTKAVIQLAVDVRATAEDENGARLLAILDRQRKNKAARNTADDDSIVASVSSNQSTFTLRSGKDNITVKAGSIPNGKDEDSLRYDGKPTPSKAENVPKGDGAGRPKTPPMPSPPSDDDSPFSDDNENTPVRPPAATGNPTGANPTAGTGGVPRNVGDLSLTVLGLGPTNVGDLGLTGLELGPTTPRNVADPGLAGLAPPAANANCATAGAGGYQLSGCIGDYPSFVGGGSALAVPDDETLTQTKGDFSVEVWFAPCSFCILKSLPCNISKL